jgi:hypothetical protein
MAGCDFNKGNFITGIFKNNPIGCRFRYEACSSVIIVDSGNCK